MARVTPRLMLAFRHFHAGWRVPATARVISKIRTSDNRHGKLYRLSKKQASSRRCCCSQCLFLAVAASLVARPRSPAMTSMEDYARVPERNVGTRSHVELRAEGWAILEQRFEHKTLVTKPYDLTYGYYVSPGLAAKQNGGRTPVLLLLHGFPDDAYLWASTLPTLTKSPYPIIVPDLLGYASTSKPTEPKMYNYAQQVESLNQIVDKEGVGNNVIPVGHDWGSAIAQRFYLLNKQRCLGVAPMSLFFSPPSDTTFNLPEVNRTTEKRFGYPQWEYWNFFTAEDGPRLMEENLERFYEALHGELPSTVPEEQGRDIWMRQLFCAPGAMRQYVSGAGQYENFHIPLKPYAQDPEFKRRWMARLSRDGLEAPLCYYRALKQNTNLEDDREQLKEEDFSKITKPYLYISFTGDWVSRTDLNREPVDRGLIADFEQHTVRAGHWSLYEKPQEIAEILADWLRRKFPA